jgi:hypothetical protein
MMEGVGTACREGSSKEKDIENAKRSRSIKAIARREKLETA